MSAVDERTAELVRGLARRVSVWRRRWDAAIRDRDQVRREAGLALRAVAAALGVARPHNLTDLRALQAKALRLRAENVELHAELRTNRDALAAALGERGDAAVTAYDWICGPIDGTDLNPAALAAEVTDLRGRLYELRELNRGWAAYGERVKARRATGCPRCGRGWDDESRETRVS